MKTVCFCILTLMTLASYCLLGDVCEAQTPKVKLIALNPDGSEIERMAFTIKPGESFHGKLQIINSPNEATDMTIYTTFASTSTTGGSIFASEQDPECWIDLPITEVSLEAGETDEFSITITAPPGAEPGEYLMGIVMEQGEAQEVEGEPFNVRYRLIKSVCVTVPGAISGGFEVVSIRQLWDGPNVFFLADLKNTGNVRVQPREGTLEVMDSSGKVIGSFPVQVQEVMPGDTISFHVASDDILPIGEYSAVVKMNYSLVKPIATESLSAEDLAKFGAVSTAELTTPFEVKAEEVQKAVEEAKKRGFEVGPTVTVPSTPPSPQKGLLDIIEPFNLLLIVAIAVSVLVIIIIILLVVVLRRPRYY